MSNTEKIDAPHLTAQTAESTRSQRAAPIGRLAKLPLEALLYYVLYGDDKLARLT